MRLSLRVHKRKDDSMNRLALTVGMICAACVSSVFAQSDLSLPADAIQQPATAFPSAAIAQNFQYMNHPPPPAPTSPVAPPGGGRGHRHRQTSSNSEGDGGASTPP
jgi:hypothetical protein